MVRSAGKSWLSVVKPTRSQNRIVGFGDAVGDGGLALAHARDDALRQDVEEKRLGARLLPLQIGDELLLAVAQPFLFQRGADARAQQDRIERLGQIVLGAGLDAAHHAVELVERRNHDDRNVAGMRRRLEPAQAPRSRSFPA